MLRVIFDSQFTCDYEWNKMLPWTLSTLHVDRVYAVEASADELTFIKDNFSGLPFLTAATTSRTVWHGDVAKFIIANFRTILIARNVIRG